MKTPFYELAERIADDGSATAVMKQADFILKYFPEYFFGSWSVYTNKVGKINITVIILLFADLLWQEEMKRKLRQIPCSDCNKIGVLCKGLCQACYSKMLRNTPEGRAKMKLYNITKGREANRRYRDKRGVKPRQIIPKGICECGVESIVKGFCRRCYNRYYQRNHYTYKVRKKKDVPFKEVLQMVKTGIAIYKACEFLHIDRRVFYNSITPLQKAELRAYKSIGAIINDDDI